MSRCKTVIRRAAFAAAAAIAASAWATPTDILVSQRVGRSAEVKPGQWHADLEKCRAYAEANGLPLVAVWSNGDFCQHCLVWEGCAISDVFVNWMKSSGMVFYFGYVGDGYLNAAGDFGGGPSADGKEGYHGASFYWCCKNQNSTMAWPYIRFYWPKGGVDIAITGSATDGEYIVKGGLPCMVRDDFISINPDMYAPWVKLGDFGTYNPGGRFLVEYIANKDSGVFKDFSATPAYMGGEFDVKSSTEAARACLEVEKNTALTTVTVPLIRKDSAVRAYAAKNKAVATYPNGTKKEYTVSWIAKQKTAELKIDVSQALVKSTAASPSIKLELYDQDGAKKGTLRIAVVDAVPNSPANPLWLGERTADTLAWGEWTMDIDVAKAKAKASAKAGSKAYTLVLVGGSLWCPDCYALDEYLIDKTEFKNWAKNKRVACVAVDEPRFTAATDSDAPTLLSHKSFESKTYGVVSGSGWLSRHDVPLTGTPSAASVLTRNLNYVNKDTNNGGLCLPEPAGSSERKTGGWKTGIPAIIMMRSDGSIAGRIYQFSNDGRTTLKNASVANLVKRLDELLAQADDTKSGEEQNDSVLAKKPTTISSRNRTGFTATLSFADQADYYKIDAPAGTDISFDLSATAYKKLSLAVVDGNAEDPDVTPVASAVNTSGSAQIRCTLPSANCFVKVSYPLNSNGYPVDSYFSLNKSSSTLCEYKLASDCVYVASEEMTVQTITDGAPEATIALEKGQVYKFTGLDTGSADNAKALSYSQATGLWTAKVSGAATLDLKAGGDGKLTFGFQKWTPGVAGFVRTAWTVAEKGNDAKADYEYKIDLNRTGGTSGALKAKILLESTTADQASAAGIYEWKDEGRVFEWLEGSNNVQSARIVIKGNPYPDGDQVLVFRLEAVGGAATTVSTGRFTLTITDDDEADAGRLALVTANGQAIPANRRIVAKGGSKLTLGASRLGGVYGPLSAKLTVGSAVKTLSWAGRDAADKTAPYTLPAYKAAGPNVVQVTLAGLDGAAVDPSAKYLTVDLVPPKSAEFSEAQVFLTGVRNVALGPRAVTVKPTSLTSGDPSKLSAAKISGSLAPGLSWEFDPDEGDAGALVLSGAPSRAGEFTATYQVSEGGTPGGTVTVTVAVTDPSVPESEGGKAKNPYIATTRTIGNVMVISNDVLVGVMTVTIPPSGRLSAKYRPLFGPSVSLMSDSWSGCTDGNYTAELDPVAADAESFGLSVTAKADGKVAVTMKGSGKELKCEVPDSSWSSSKSASAWKGYYTVSLPVEETEADSPPLASGAGYVTLRMTASQAVNSGKVSFAGVLPNGKAFSGMAVLARGSGKNARLPVVWSGETDSVSGIFLLNQTADKLRHVWAYSSVSTYWAHEQAAAESASYIVTLGVYGALYDPTSLNMESCCLDTFKTQYLTFFAQPDLLNGVDRFARGKAAAWPTKNETVWVRQKDGATKISLKDAAAAKAESGLTFSFSQANGIVSGALKLDFVASTVDAKYRAVVLPGWGVGDGCADCTDTEATKRPFISGACWFNDTYKYAGESASVRRGCPVSVGVTPGK